MQVIELPDEFELEVTEQDIDLGRKCIEADKDDSYSFNCGITQALKRRFGQEISFATHSSIMLVLSKKKIFDHDGEQFIQQFDDWIARKIERPTPVNVKFVKVEEEG
jgi:hypothetical protein